MSAPVVSLRALVVEDIARAAERANRPAAAMLLRRCSTDTAALRAVDADLRTASTPAARIAGGAAGRLADDGPRGAAFELARHCGLNLAEWAAESAREQGVRYAEPEAV